MAEIEGRNWRLRINAQKEAEEAARFYASIFPESEVIDGHKAIRQERRVCVLTVNFTVLGIPCLGLNCGPKFSQREAFSFQIATYIQEETDRYWDAIISNGFQSSTCGWCKDRWGISWQITPRALTEAMAAGRGGSQARVRGDDGNDKDRRGED